MNTDNLKQKIKNSLDKLYKNDTYLFTEDLNERSITFKLAKYLEEENFGDGYFVDHEYNRAKLMVLSGKMLPHIFETKEIIKNDDGNYFTFNYDFSCYIVLGLEKEQTIIEIYQKNMEILRIIYSDL